MKNFWKIRKYLKLSFLHALEIESLGLPALLKPGSHIVKEKLQEAYMFPGPQLQLKKRAEMTSLAPTEHWKVSSALVWFRERKNQPRWKTETILTNWGRKKFKGVLLKDMFLSFFDNQMPPTIFL